MALGMKNVILEPINSIEKIHPKLKKKIQNFSNMNIFFRINLRLKSVEDFKKKIKNYNNFQDILSVESLNREVQLQSARDSRVDIITFSDPEILKTLTPGVISLTKQNRSLIEFSLAPIMVRNRSIQSKNFRNLYKFIQLALKLKANYIVSGNFINFFDYRHPRALSSICHSLLGIPLNKAKNSLSNIPKMLIEKVAARFDNKFEMGLR
jgi:RNase P/RNase MRP subunit p30